MGREGSGSGERTETLGELFSGGYYRHATRCMEGTMESNDAPQAPPGWYPDPATGSRRFWDGQAWSDPPPDAATGESRGAGPPKADRPDVLNRLTAQPSTFWAAALACVLMIVGGLGTWATALGFVSISGTHGDGWIVVGAGALGLASLWGYAMDGRALTLLAAVAFGVVGGGTSGYDLHKIVGVGATDLFGKQFQLVHAGWGIYMALGASVVLIFLALSTLTLGPADGRSNAALVFTSVVLAVAAVVVVSNVGTSNAESTTGAASGAASRSASAEEIETTPSEPESPLTAAKVREVLDEYAQFYSSENANALAKTFAPRFTRHDAKHALEDREEALETYERQFSELQHPSYELTTPEITLDQSGATAKSSYTITSQNGTVTGRITFHLISAGGIPQIDKIGVVPTP